jgi:hypothetical protein
VLNRLAVSLVGMTVMLTATLVVRADPLPVGQNGSTSPIGFWTFAPVLSGAGSNAGAVVSLYDSGEMSAFSLASWSALNSQDAFANNVIGGGLVIGGTAAAPTTFTINASDSEGNPLSAQTPSADLTWAPDAVTLQPGYGPLVATWTALADGSYTVSASVSPSQITGSSGSLPDPNGSGSDPFSQAISFKAGDTITFVSSGSTGINHFTSAGDGGSTGFNVNLSPFEADPVPEPSQPVALAGFALMGLLGFVFASWRRRKPSAVDCRP